jgi:hypothetical protein
MKTKKNILTFIDPPGGWKYGFPKPVTKEEFDKITSFREWCINNGYPKEEADLYGEHFYVQISEKEVESDDKG